MKAVIAAAVLLVTVSASMPGGRIEAAPDQAFLTQYCAGCHNPGTKRGDLVLQGLDPSQVDGRIDAWEKVVRKLRTGMMPPAAAPKPSPAARDAFTSALEAQLDRAAALHPDPGATALH